MNRVCAGLPGEPCTRITEGSRCPEHKAAYERKRARRVKGAYDAEWRRIRDRAVREHPWCSICHAPDTPENPLTGDHIVPRARGGRNERGNVQVLCRGCNSRKGATQE